MLSKNQFYSSFVISNYILITGSPAFRSFPVFGTSVADQTLEILEKEMNPDGFFRISRQYIVSIKAILNIHQSFNGQLKFDLAPSLNEGVLISRKKSNQLKNWLNQSGL